LLGRAGEAVAYSLNPLPKQLGQKYGKCFPAVRKALLELPAEEAAPQLLAGHSVDVTADGETIAVLPEEVEVRAQARSGFAVAVDGAYLAALVTDLTPELVEEGLAREFVRRVQDLRKQADLDIADRIRVYYQASPGLAKAVKSFSDYIMTETLTVALSDRPAPEGAATISDTFDDETVSIGLIKA
jgi:isoleucyl-tRNA synthetase